ncbi:aminotransferase class V-fold PLP-dependent enzyme [soil metagenome]
MTDPHTPTERPLDDVAARLRTLQAGDLPVHGGRILAYVYDSGLTEVDRIAREAVASFAGSNGLDPTAFPSLLQMENDLVAFAAGLLDAPSSVVGTITSGGTESVLLAVQTARDARPDISRPAMVLPSTAHAAFHKAAHYFGVEARVVDVDAGFRADPEAMRAAVDDRTVLMVASAPSYAHGVVDPVREIAAVAAERGLRCHVDACIGGWVLPYARRSGRAVPDWTFEVEGVTSISVDLHKYAYAPKGASLLLHRSPELRRAQYFASAAWPGYTMLNSTMQSTRSGGPVAGAWATVQSIGDAGYRRLADEVFAAVDEIAAGVSDIAGIEVLVKPDSTLLALVTNADCDPFTICDEMAERGFFVQPQLSYAGLPATLHLSVSAATLPHVGELLEALAASATAALAAGPVVVDAGVAAYVAALDPAEIGAEEFDGLLAAAGLISEGGPGDTGGTEGLELPTRMAEVNALLDLAAPALREAVLVAFLDRLQRPNWTGQ